MNEEEKAKNRNEEVVSREVLRLQENNAVIDHLCAVQEILRRKCARCNAMSCMGCCYDSLDGLGRLLTAALSLMGREPHDRKDVVATAQREEERLRQIFKDR